MKRVLVLNHYALPRSQAGGTRHVDLFGRLESWLPTIFATSRNHTTQEEFTTDDPRFVLASTPRYAGNGAIRISGWAVYSAKAVAYGLKMRRLDVVYASSPHLLSLVAGLIVSTIRRVPLIIEIRDLWPKSIVSAGLLTPNGTMHRFLCAIERQTCRRADHIVVVTTGWEEHFESLGVLPSRITVIPNGCEIGDFHVEHTKANLRELWGFTGTTAVFAGSHGPKDGIDLVLDAASKLPDIDFVLVGAGSSKDAAINRAAGEGLENVRFMDPIAKAELATLLKACDIGIHAVTPLPVFDDGMSPNKLFDYMASGLPIVSNARRPLRQVLTDGECGRLGGPHDLAECISDVSQATDLQRERWSEAGLDLVTSHFSRDAAAARLETALNNVSAQVQAH